MRDVDALAADGEIRLVQVGNGPLRVDTRPERHAHLRCTEVIFSGRCPTCAGDPPAEWQLEAAMVSQSTSRAMSHQHEQRTRRTDGA